MNETKTWFMDENQKVVRIRFEDDVTFADLERVRPGVEHYRVTYGDKVRLGRAVPEYRVKGEKYYHKRFQANTFIRKWVSIMASRGKVHG